MKGTRTCPQEPSTGVLTASGAQIEGRVVCDTRAAACRCFKDAGHVEAGDPVHACDPTRCTGQWSGDFHANSGRDFHANSGRDFVGITMPRQVGPQRPWEFA